MSEVTNLVTIISLLLALAVAGDATKGRSTASSPPATREASAKPVPRGAGCDDWGCGTNHNETLICDVAPIK